jgi:hypothetical protein
MKYLRGILAFLLIFLVGTVIGVDEGNNAEAKLARIVQLRRLKDKIASAKAKRLATKQQDKEALSLGLGDEEESLLAVQKHHIDLTFESWKKDHTHGTKHAEKKEDGHNTVNHRAETRTKAYSEKKVVESSFDEWERSHLDKITREPHHYKRLLQDEGSIPTDLTISASYGSNSLIVADMEKSFTFSGSSVNENDTVRWIRYGTDCENFDSIVHSQSASYSSTASITSVDSSHQATFSFPKTAQLKNVSLCYKFATVSESNCTNESILKTIFNQPLPSFKNKQIVNL